VGTHDPYLILIDPSYSDVHNDSPMFMDGGDPFHLSDGCGTIDGMPASCSEIGDRFNSGTVSIGYYNRMQWTALDVPNIGLGYVPTHVYKPANEFRAYNDEGRLTDYQFWPAEWIETGLSLSIQTPADLPSASRRRDRTAYLLPSNPVSALDQGLVAARNALQNPLCRALFGDTDPVSMLGTYLSNGLIQVGTSYAVAQRGGGTTSRNFRSADVGAVTNYATGSYQSPDSPNVRISANPITINQNGFYFTGRTANGMALNTLRGRGFEGLSLTQIRGAVIIHELLHAATRIPSDDENPEQSQRNSELVRLLCFPSASITPTRGRTSNQLLTR
jgi:hypothetical protein